MPQQLIYTSAPRGITSGRSGYCTVARSAEMREALATHLEQLSYYHHQALTGGIERPVHAFRVLDVRGTRCFVLSRIQDAGLDFTKRTNFLAHHLVFTPEEIATLGSPPLLFLYWDGWKPSWDGEPELLSGENWGNLHEIKGFESDPDRHYETAPARGWKQLTGAAVNAFGLLDLRGAACLAANEESDEVLLRLFAESLRMMELRNRDVDFHAKAWEFTFTTNFQEQDNPSDFRWRCVHTEALNTGNKQAEAVPFREVRSQKHSAEDKDFATIGPHPAVIVETPTEVTVNEGQDANLQVDARGIPYPNVQWYWNGNCFAEGATPECVLKALKPGVGQFCEVRARNAYGQASARIRVSVEPTAKPVTQQGGRTSPKEDWELDFATQSPETLVKGTLFLSGGNKDKVMLWKYINALNRRNCTLANVATDELKQLYLFCINQKEDSTKRIAERCIEELGNWFRITTYLRANIWKSIVVLLLILLIVGGLILKALPVITGYVDAIKEWWLRR